MTKKHICQWMAMPYDINKGGAYYRLTCLACNESFGESFIPSFDGRLIFREGCKATVDESTRAIEQAQEWLSNREGNR